jgi:drug/metabolite transporter (DMT)-like permease
VRKTARRPDRGGAALLEIGGFVDKKRRRRPRPNPWKLRRTWWLWATGLLLVFAFVAFYAAWNWLGSSDAVLTTYCVNAMTVACNDAAGRTERVVGVA